MAIGSINSQYTNQIFNYTQPVKNKSSENIIDVSYKENTTDFVEISSEAFEAEIINEFTKKTIDLLKIRRLTDGEIHSFKIITDDAKKSDNPKSFLKSLNVDERILVKKSNSYGLDLTDSHIDQMSEEGARNMLVEPTSRHYVDLNNDGIVDHGMAKTFVFPPPNSPEKIKDAWDKTIDNLPESEQLLASSIFLTQQLSANIKYDDAGKAIGFYGSEDEEYTNIFPVTTNSWFSLLDTIDSYLNFSKTVAQTPKDLMNIEKDMELISQFRSNIEN